MNSPSDFQNRTSSHCPCNDSEKSGKSYEDHPFIQFSSSSSLNNSSSYPVQSNQTLLKTETSPPNSHHSSPSAPSTSLSSPNNLTLAGNIIDLNSIVSYSQLLQSKHDVISTLRHRSGDHLAVQALEIFRAGRERVKQITAAGRVASGRPPVKHIQEQYLAVFSRFSEFCASQGLPTWPIEPVRVAIWILAMQEKAPPTPATLRQYITRLEFTNTVTSPLFEQEFGPSYPLKGSALLRELVNRDLPGQNMRPPKPSSSRKRIRSISTFSAERSPTPKKWQEARLQPHCVVYTEPSDPYIRSTAPNYSRMHSPSSPQAVWHENHPHYQNVSHYPKDDELLRHQSEQLGYHHSPIDNRFLVQFPHLSPYHHHPHHPSNTSPGLGMAFFPPTPSTPDPSHPWV